MESMAGEPWNRVNIPFPSAASSVPMKLTAETAAASKLVLLENDKVLKLIRSKILQTEIRVLYELLYILTNSFRNNKTFKGLQQVEQCVNRLKNMKLDAALQELADLCPQRIQIALSMKTGECDVPSQPMLEWICLKVLGASKLLSCTMARCTTAFLLSKRQMKWEFIILNVVITSMLSRLWVIFRGILVGLGNLYQNLLELLKDVAQARPMPYLTDVSLPADMAEFLGPSDASLLKKQRALGSHAKNLQVKQQPRKEVSVKDANRDQMGKLKEDLGVSVVRGLGFDADIKPFATKTKVKSVSEDLYKNNEKQKLKKQIEEATTFCHMSANLEGMIKWRRSQRMEKMKRLLTFLHLKCQRMKCLEAAGHNMQRKLRAFRQEVCRALSPQGKTCHFYPATRRTAGLRSRLQSLKTQFILFRIRAGVKKRRLARGQKEAELPVYFNSFLQSKAAHEATLQITDSHGCDDIDDIFASAGL
ncbi:nucleolus and neural progenitor protein [Kryptolebias marmoratus]|uniref:Nucleolus and neural progenitor protein n=1 Tax=Kryptolebias marmoratus TaxID=37003 RepID=A0A3Q3GC65_KRYMA|nr:nucleolus and neural progenitor protein [Kryptolebias marmoratus]